MKNLTFIITIVISAAATAQPLVNISAGASTSGPYANLSIGIKASDGVTVHGSYYVSDKALLLTAQGGYNAQLGERFNLQVSGGGGWLKHNAIKAEKVKASKSFVPVISASLDWVWGERGGMFLEAFSALKMHGAGIGFKFYIQ